jgi:hypothetical protein
MMSLDPSRWPLKRHRRDPLHAFLERHPTLPAGIAIRLSCAGLIYLAAHRFLFTN